MQQNNRTNNKVKKVYYRIPPVLRSIDPRFKMGILQYENNKPEIKTNRSN